MKSSKINIDVSLDEQNVPSKITWTADSQPGSEPNEAKAMLLSLFDEKTMDTLRIDLWTKEMQVIEMDRFYYHTLKSMCDSYLRATNNKELAEMMRRFVQFFGEEVEILEKPKDDV